MLFKKNDDQNLENNKVKEKILNKIKSDINNVKSEFNVKDIDFKKQLDDYIEEKFEFNENFFRISTNNVYNKYDFHNFKLNKIDPKKYLEFLDKNNLIPKNKIDLYKSSNLNKREITIDFEKYIEDLVYTEVYLEYFKLFDSIRKKIIDDLIKKMKMIEEMTSKLKSFENVFGRFLDLSEHDLYKMDDSFLIRLETLLNEKEFIKRIADLLGRLAESQNKYEEYLIKESILVPSNKKTFYSPENIVSIKFGNDLSSILKYQILLRAKKETKPIFDYNFIELKLLQFDQNAKMLDEEEIFRKERRLKKDSKGPFILCIDTSGSMHGEPETIAKAISLCIFKIAKRENRKCYIINFSTGIVEFDASDVNSNFNKFYDFLIMSFSGGTDVEPALKRACEKCLENNYINSDILIISDFIINQISNDLISKIMKLKKNKIRFNALSIGCSQIKEHMNYFDNNWVYDGSDESINKIISDLNNIENKNGEENEKPKMTFLNYIPEKRYDIVGTIILKLDFNEEIKTKPLGLCEGSCTFKTFSSQDFEQNNLKIFKILDENMEVNNDLEFDYIIDIKKINNLTGYDLYESNHFDDDNNHLFLKKIIFNSKVYPHGLNNHIHPIIIFIGLQ